MNASFIAPIRGRRQFSILELTDISIARFGDARRFINKTSECFRSFENSVFSAFATKTTFLSSQEHSQAQELSTFYPVIFFRHSRMQDYFHGDVDGNEPDRMTRELIDMHNEPP